MPSLAKAALAAMLAICLPAVANAQTDPAPGPAASPATPFETGAIGDEMLQAIAGREDVTQIAQADQAATVTRNSVGDNVHTGDARIADNAFQNMQGLSILNVNTGNNVAINAAMNVTISIPGQ